MFECSMTSSTDSAHSEVHCSLAGGLKSGLFFSYAIKIFSKGSNNISWFASTKSFRQIYDNNSETIIWRILHGNWFILLASILILFHLDWALSTQTYGECSKFSLLCYFSKFNSQESRCYFRFYTFLISTSKKVSRFPSTTCASYN